MVWEVKWCAQWTSPELPTHVSVPVSVKDVDSHLYDKFGYFVSDRSPARESKSFKNLHDSDLDKTETYWNVISKGF